MTNEEIHNIYLHMSGKAEGLVETTGEADFPVLFARAILEYEGLTKDVQNMASKSTYKEQLETKDDPQIAFNSEVVGYVAPQRTWVELTEEDLKLLSAEYRIVYGSWVGDFAKGIEDKLKESNT
jgi:hypothetical protein